MLLPFSLSQLAFLVLELKCFEDIRDSRSSGSDSHVNEVGSVLVCTRVCF